MAALSSNFDARRFESVRRIAAVGFVLSFAILPFQVSRAVEATPIRIAVFEFELKDTSAGGGVIAQDAVDTEHLKASTEQARTMLVASGRYAIVDTSGVAAEVTSAGGVVNCGGCDIPLAKKLGAEQSMVGVVTRVGRVEYTVQILIADAASGAVVANDFSGLRMGANYSWPRGVKSLMNRILPTQSAQ